MKLLDKTQEEAKLRTSSFDSVVRVAVGKYLKALTTAHEQEEAKTRECACLLLKAHFEEVRNEFLTKEHRKNSRDVSVYFSHRVQQQMKIV